MGFFDNLFNKKLELPKEKNIDLIINPPNKPIFNCNFDINDIPKEIFSLLWFGDGPHKNYDNEKSTITTDYGFVTLNVGFAEEPSLIYTDLPVQVDKANISGDSIGYFPSYQKLTPSQRFVYLNWLSDISQKVDIGYVFIFYYGLERHLLYGDYHNAIKIINILRKSHDSPSFQGYSRTALLMASIIKKDKNILEALLKNIDPDERDDNILLLSKYLLKVDLTPDEIMGFASKAGFSNKNYIKKYPQIFRNVVMNELFKSFGKNSFPFYELQMEITKKEQIIFANYSFDQDLRSPNLPDLINNNELKNSLYSILLNSHNEVKNELTQSRKKGITITPLNSSKPDIDNKCDYLSDLCPYCHNKLEKLPQKKKACNFCKKNIFVRTRPIDRKKVLIREDQIEEFENESNNYYRTKAANLIIGEYKEHYPSEFSIFHNNIDSLVIDATEKEVVLKIMEKEANQHYNDYNMGLFRNSLLKRGDFLSETQDDLRALKYYLLVCYIDLNGPNNCGSILKYPDLIAEYPPFDLSKEKNTTLAPGVIAYIKNIIKKLSILPDDMHRYYLDAKSLLSNKKFILDYNDSWQKIEIAIFEENVSN